LALSAESANTPYHGRQKAYPPVPTCCRWARPKLRPSGGTINYANLGVDPNADEIARARADLPPELTDRVSFAVAGAAEVDAPHVTFDLALFSHSL
jgi:hypothetical protein